MRHSLSSISLTAFIAAALTACVAHPDDAPCEDCATPDGLTPDAMAPDAMAPEPAETCPPLDTPLDLLLVIDDSGSMCEEQAALTDAVATVHAELIARGSDYRLAVVTTDMDPHNPYRGAFGSPAAPTDATLNCVDAAGEPVAPDTAHCGELDLAPVLDPTGLDPAAIEARLRCMTQPGTHGDGFEKGLAAVAHALDCAGPNADQLATCCVDPADCDRPFLRPGAALAIVVIADEDDCTDPAMMLDEAPALECDRAAPGDDCAIPRTDNNACAHYADRLVPPAELAATVRALHPTAPAITAAALVGPAHAPIDGHPVRFVPGDTPAGCLADGERRVDAECCPDGVCAGDLALSCQGALGGAFDGTRYRAFAAALNDADCQGGACASICDADPAFEPLPILAAIDAALRPKCE